MEGLSLIAVHRPRGIHKCGQNSSAMAFNEMAQTAFHLHLHFKILAFTRPETRVTTRVRICLLSFLSLSCCYSIHQLAAAEMTDIDFTDIDTTDLRHPLRKEFLIEGRSDSPPILKRPTEAKQNCRTYSMAIRRVA